MKLSEEEYANSLAHYGILRKSGRYPWGSGANPGQRSKSFLDMFDDLKKNHGMTEKQIAEAFSTPDHPFTTRHLRDARTIAVNHQKIERVREARRLKEKGMGDSEIGRQMGVNESTVRGYLAPGRQAKLEVLQATADMLRRQVSEKEFIDVGSAVERSLPLGDNPAAQIGISRDKFQSALAILKDEGYNVHPLHTKQVGTGEITKNLVLCKPGVTKQEVFKNKDRVRQISEQAIEGGKEYRGLQPPISISSKRVAVRYKEDGGADADGVIYVRPGVSDISLGKSRYAQVRIAVDNSHYLKGMAVYKDDLPPGVDLLFNTNKANTGDKYDAMKPYKADPEGKVDPVNPFGAAIPPKGQIISEKTGKVTSAMNKVNEEGDWDTWSKNLSRQVLSKQQPDLIRTQLDLTHENRRREFDTIVGLTNPTVREKLLKTFSDETDSAAVEMKAAHMPRQETKVILPSNHVKPTEVFAPTFRDGERVVLLRFPHAGTFEIPELTVNNRSREVKKMFGTKNVRDAIVIHPKTAVHLSGADFDGDHVLVIPNNKGDIKTQPALERLKGFDPQMYQVPYGPITKEFPKGTPIIKASRKEAEMGLVTNLISDMTIRGAPMHEIADAVRHSMVVIDSEKHNLDFKASERDHGIRKLRARYQGEHRPGVLKGASTLITRATAPEYVDKRRPAHVDEDGPINKITGKKQFVATGEKKKVLVKDKETGTKQYITVDEPAKFRSKKLAETDDAFSLVSDGIPTVQERIYAEHSNRLKALANEARREMVNTTHKRRNESAVKTYADEVANLKFQLDRAKKNAPFERRAQAVANANIAQIKRANPGFPKEAEKKMRNQQLEAARARVGAKKHKVDITPRHWEAIQAGAVSPTVLREILQHADIKKIKELATPKERTVMTSTVVTRARQMLANGYSPNEVAEALGVSLSSVKTVVVDGGES